MPRLHHLPGFLATDSPRPGGLSEFAWKLMQAEDRNAALKNLRLISILAAIMVPTFAVLDYFAYPEHLGLFVSFRVMCTLSILGLLVVVNSEYGKRYFRVLTVALPLFPAFFISLMILYSQDPATPYYAGLTLCIVAIGLLFHWTYREAFIVAATVLVMYLIACSPAIVNGMDSRTVAGFVNNCIFLVAKGTVVVCGSLMHHGYRVEEFAVRDRLRKEKIKLRAQREELIRTLGNLRETEGQLIQSEKMASLGQLSAGVIHEIGNPLNYSNQALFLLRKLLKAEPENAQMQDAVEDIQDSIDRMKDIVKELREFSHKSGELLIEYPLQESVKVALRMLGKEISDSETLVSTDIPEDIRIEGVKNQITQVVINLVHNAIQAMEGKGSAEVKRVRIHAETKGNLVELTICDNGPGIPEETVKHIFDPFFTTKEVGEGTGLGLSICYRIIEAHHGNIRAESVVGSHTCFTMTFPNPDLVTSPPNESHPKLQSSPRNDNAVC